MVGSNYDYTMKYHEHPFKRKNMTKIYQNIPRVVRDGPRPKFGQAQSFRRMSQSRKGPWRINHWVSQDVSGGIVKPGRFERFKPFVCLLDHVSSKVAQALLRLAPIPWVLVSAKCFGQICAKKFSWLSCIVSTPVHSYLFNLSSIQSQSLRMDLCILALF